MITLPRPFAVMFATALVTAPAAGQTMRGTLLERGTDRPINLGRIALLTEAGDSLTATITADDGRFVVASQEPGRFLLHATALGYREALVGVFVLGEGGAMTVEFRLEREAVTIEGLVVEAERMDRQPALMRSGFYDRLMRGLGTFITPADIEASPALYTTDLLLGIPGVSVRYATGGDRVFMTGTRGLCSPTVYVDGMQVAGGPIGAIAPLQTVEAIEVYRRPSEIPIQYSGVRSGGRGSCGVILIWTRS